MRQVLTFVLCLVMHILCVNALKLLLFLDKVRRLAFFGEDRWQPWASPSDLHFTFFSVSCLPKSLMLEYRHFSATTGTLYYDGWMTLQSGWCQVFCSYQCWLSANTYCILCNALWLSIFCALLLCFLLCLWYCRDHEFTIISWTIIIIKKSDIFT